MDRCICHIGMYKSPTSPISTFLLSFFSLMTERFKQVFLKAVSTDTTNPESLLIEKNLNEIQKNITFRSSTEAFLILQLAGFSLEELDKGRMIIPWTAKKSFTDLLH